MINKKNSKVTVAFNKNRTVQRALRPSAELKAVDTDVNLTMDTTGAIRLLNGVVPGVGFSQRIGRSISMRGLDLRLTASVVAGTGVDQIQRVLVVLDHQPNGAAPVITDILDAVSTESRPNLINAWRFTILQDTRFDLNASAEPGSKRAITEKICLGRSTHYNNGVAGTVADIVTNSLFLVFVGSEAAGATAGTVTGTSRVRFVDF